MLCLPSLAVLRIMSRLIRPPGLTLLYDRARIQKRVHELALSICRDYGRPNDQDMVVVCVLIDKRERRSDSVTADHIGFELREGFVVGYGIDYAERYRHLPDIFTIDRKWSPSTREVCSSGLFWGENMTESV